MTNHNIIFTKLAIFENKHGGLLLPLLSRDLKKRLRKQSVVCVAKGLTVILIMHSNTTPDNISVQ